MSSGEDHLLTTIQEHYSMSGQNNSNLKKQGVSGKSLDPEASAKLVKIEKDFRTKQMIKDALLDNDFLKNLNSSQMREVIDYMELKKVPQGTYVVREGDSGSHLYVSAEGEYEVIKDSKVLGRLGGGKAFGELAILYNCKRTASIKGTKMERLAKIDIPFYIATSAGEVWVLERSVFQQIMMRTGLQKLHDQLQFLKTVPLFKNMTDDQLLKLSDAFEMVH